CDNRDIWTGQGSLGLGLVASPTDLATSRVGLGGGGLIAGVAAAAKAAAAKAGRTVRIIGVQAENAAAMPVSLAEGHPVEITTQPTIADGILVAQPGAVPFEIIKDLVDEVVTVTDDDIA